jgi:hypothetical protein
VAHGLEHLDRDDRVVLALDRAVVAQLDPGVIGEPGRPDPLRREGLLGR